MVVSKVDTGDFDFGDIERTKLGHNHPHVKMLKPQWGHRPVMFQAHRHNTVEQVNVSHVNLLRVKLQPAGKS